MKCMYFEVNDQSKFYVIVLKFPKFIKLFAYVEMGEVPTTATASAFLSKIAYLFNNSLYSDVEFAFEHAAGRNIYCHKLILALRSKTFSRMFYEDENSMKVVKLPASKRKAFYFLIKFIYTDEVKFNTFEDAVDLLLLAKEYSVKELVNKCYNHISQNQLTVNNLFPRYTFALKKKSEIVLRDCRNFVCSNIQLIFKSDGFTNASPDVVKDIIKQDNLSLSTELEVIEAVLNWGSASLKRRNMLNDGKLLRECIDPFLKYLRILSLTTEEFENLVKKYDIFNGYESVILTKKISQPESNVKLPIGICNLPARRNAVQTNVTSSDHNHQNRPLTSDVHSSLKHQALKSEDSESNECMTGNIISYEVTKCAPESSEIPLSNIGKITYEVKKNILEVPKASSARRRRTKLKSSSSIENSTFSCNPVYNASQTLMKDFLFCLLENETSFKSSFKNDITSSISFKMKRGNLLLIGLELKIKNKSTATEELEVFVELKGFSKATFSRKYKEELSNDVLPLKFPKGMLLREGKTGQLEISVDDLILNRCCVCATDSQFELNNGPGFACELSISSNKKLIFLINRLMYMPI